MGKITRIEVIPDIISLKIASSDEKGVYDVTFNQGYLVPFKFDGDKFFVQFYNKEQHKALIEKFEGVQDKEKDKNYMKEVEKLKIEREEIKVYHQKDPTSEIIDLSNTVKSFLELSK